MRSICARSSSRRSCCSKRRIWSRVSGSPPSSRGWPSLRRSSARRIRCTSTPSTPEPSPRRPSVAMARRARSRMAPSSPARIASIARSRSSSRSTSASAPPSASGPPRASRTSCVTACASAARKKKRSKTRSKTRRSSGDLASVAASASRNGPRSVHGTVSSAANASSSSDVPMASPSARRASVKSTSWAGRRHAGPRGEAEPHPDALRDDVEVGPVLDDDAHRGPEHVLVDVLGAEQEQGARPVDRLRDRRRLLEVEVAHVGDHLDELLGDGVGQLGRVHAHDLELALRAGVVEPEVQAAALERLGQLARVVRGEQHDRVRAGLDPAQLRDRDLEVRQQLEQHRLELLVGLVDLVDQEHDRLLGGDRVHERPREQELLAEDVVLHGVPARAGGLGLDPQQLLAVVPLVQRLRLVQALVALEPHERAVEVGGERLGQLGLADAGRPLDEHRLAEPGGEEGDERGRLAREVAGGAEPGVDVGDRCGSRGHAGRPRIDSPPCRSPRSPRRPCRSSC